MDKDKTGPEADGGGRGRPFWIVAGLVGLVAVAVVSFTAGRMTADEADPLGSPTTLAQPATTQVTPSTTVEGPREVVLESGEPLDWKLAAEIGDGWPISLLHHDGSTYVFTAELLETRGPAGMDAWVSTDGTEWRSLGTVIESTVSIHSVVSTTQGLLALGADESPRVWRSTDGQNWAPVDLPSETATSDLTTFYLQAAAATDDVVVVMGSSHVDVENAIIEALPDELKTEDGHPPYGMSWGGPPFSASIQGPLGITVFHADAEELGLTADEIASLLHGGPMEERITVWSSTDGQTWTTTELEGGHVNQLLTTPEHALQAIGYGPFGPRIWTSTDGVTWAEQDVRDDAEVLTTWNESMLGIRHYGPTPELVISRDGAEWESVGVSQLLDQLVSNGHLSWHFHPLAAGPTGIATVAHGYDESEMHHMPDPVVLEKVGYVLTSNEMRGVVTLEEDGVEILELFVHGEQVHEEVDVDFQERTMTFLHPETRESLVTFTFDEIEEAQMEAYKGSRVGQEHRIFLFSADGQIWRSQDIDALFGPETDVGMMQVLDDHIIATVSEFGGGVSDPGSVAIWIGTP